MNRNKFTGGEVSLASATSSSARLPAKPGTVLDNSGSKHLRLSHQDAPVLLKTRFSPKRLSHPRTFRVLRALPRFRRGARTLSPRSVRSASWSGKGISWAASTLRRIGRPPSCTTFPRC